MRYELGGTYAGHWTLDWGHWIVGHWTFTYRLTRPPMFPAISERTSVSVLRLKSAVWMTTRGERVAGLMGGLCQP